MQVTNVTVKLSPRSGDRLKAFSTMTLDGEFVVRDLKIIEGTSGLFVAMPSRKLTEHCPKCSGKNHLRAKFCNDCGASLPEKRISDEDAQSKLHADVAHPINPECRAKIQDAVLEAYHEELQREGRAGEAESVRADSGEPPQAAEPTPEPGAEEGEDAESAGEEEPPSPEPGAEEGEDAESTGEEEPPFGEGII